MKSGNPDPSVLFVPPKWYRQYRNLQSLRGSLLQDHSERMSRIFVTLEPAGSDSADSAEEEIRHVMALGILTHEHDALFEVDSAIERILDGTYGICEMTGKPIPEARLRVVPWTRYTKEALEKIERTGMTVRPALDFSGRSRAAKPGKPSADSNADERFALMVLA